MKKHHPIDTVSIKSTQYDVNKALKLRDRLVVEENSERKYVSLKIDEQLAPHVACVLSLTLYLSRTFIPIRHDRVDAIFKRNFFF